MFVFDAPDCVAADRAAADWVLSASWPMAWIPLPGVQRQSPPRLTWLAFCLSPFRFPAFADELTLFDCETSPPSPELRTRTGMLVLLAPCCVSGRQSTRGLVVVRVLADRLRAAAALSLAGTLAGQVRVRRRCR